MTTFIAILATLLLGAGSYSMWRAWRRPRRPDAGCSGLVLGLLGGAIAATTGAALLLYLRL